MKNEISLTLLRALGACQVQRESFANVFGEHALINSDNIKTARYQSLSIKWLFSRLHALEQYYFIDNQYNDTLFTIITNMDTTTDDYEDALIEAENVFDTTLASALLDALQKY